MLIKSISWLVVALSSTDVDDSIKEQVVLSAAWEVKQFLWILWTKQLHCVNIQ